MRSHDGQEQLILFIVPINQQVQREEGEKGVAALVDRYNTRPGAFVGIGAWVRVRLYQSSCWLTFCTQGPYRSDGWPAYIKAVQVYPISAYKSKQKDIWHRCKTTEIRTEPRKWRGNQKLTIRPPAPCLINSLGRPIPTTWKGRSRFLFLSAGYGGRYRVPTMKVLLCSVSSEDLFRGWTQIH